MAVLTKPEILKAMEAGDLEFDPFDPDCVGPASVDLHISNQFRIFKKLNQSAVIKDETRYEDYTELVTVEDTLMLLPGEFVLGLTRERITLASHLCGRLDGRSRFARMGLTMHITAGFMQPGISNQQVLEIFNASPIPLKLTPGTRICQFIVETCLGEATYQGKFRDQKL